MFTEGLDEKALNWVKEGVEVKVKPPAYSSENISPNLVNNAPLMYPAPNFGKPKSWGLPASNLLGIHCHSGLLGRNALAGSVVLDVDNSDGSDDGDDESVGSVPDYSSPGERVSEDDYDLQENPLLHHRLRHHESTYEYKCRYRYDRLQKFGSEHFFDSRVGPLCEAKRMRDPPLYEDSGFGNFRFQQQKPCSGAGSSEDSGSPEDEENGMYQQAEKGNWPEYGCQGKGQDDKEEHPNVNPQPNSFLEVGTPSAPPMFDPTTEITEDSDQTPILSASLHSVKDGAIKTEPNNRWVNMSTVASPVHDMSTEIKRCNLQEQEEIYTRPDSEEVDVQTSCRQTNSLCNLPIFHVSGHGAWQTLLAYEACIRLCLRAWATGSMEAPEFLRDECALLRNAFGLQKILLQPQEELLRNGPMSCSIEETSAPKLKRNLEKIKVEVHKVKIKLAVPSSCCFPCVGTTHEPLKSLGKRFSNIKSAFLAGWEAVRKIRVVPHAPLQATYSQRGVAYMQAGVQYVQEVSQMIKTGVSTLCNSTAMEKRQETFSCLLHLKSVTEEESASLQSGSSVCMQPGSGDTHIFFPEGQGDALSVEVHNSEGNSYGRSWIKLASITDDINDKVRWWPIYNEKHERVGKVQLSVTLMTTSGELRPTKCGPVGETLAYDLVLEAALRMQNFQSHNLHLHGPWKWLLIEFASYYGVSDSYTKLRYLSRIMDVATPTRDCFELLYELLVPIIKARDENSLSRQEKRMLAESEDRLEHLLATAFENYKSLDESSPSGLSDIFSPASGIAAPALSPAVQIYTLLHDILSHDAQATLRNYLQMAARKRCKRHMAETDEFISSNSDGFLMDSLAISTAYLKMKALCVHVREEVYTDIEIHNQHILPSSIDLQNITSAVYNVELCNRLRTFLVACPPSSPSLPVVELLIATADFQRDLAAWNICPIKGGVDSKDLFHLYIILWIQDKQLHLLDFCKLDKVRLSETTTQHLTSPFVEEMYERIKDTLNEYEAIINRWPEYSIDLENAITIVERTVMRALEKQYNEILNPLKDGMIPKKFGLQYMQKLTKRGSECLYNVPSQLGLFLNTIKRILDVLHPKVETQLRSWASCLPTSVEGDKKMVFGEQLNGITVILRTKYKTFLQAIVEKLVDNTHMQRTTKLKRILEDTKEAGGENDIRERMQLLNAQLIDTICHLHDTFASQIFVDVCRGFWDRMGQDVLYFLETRKENRSWYKGSRFALGILDDTFASQMQRLQGNVLQNKDLEPPRSIMEARSMLC